MAKKITLSTLMQMKEKREPITVLTCYDAPTAGLLERAGIDCLLVGDSFAQVILGHNTTCQATMEVMIPITAAVRRGAPQVFLMGDMPFLSYQMNREETLRNAGRFMCEAGCDAVKVEVDCRHTEIVRDLARAGIPVVAHLGYRPQSAQQQSKIVATREADIAVSVVKDAMTMVEAGATMLLLECVCANVAQAVTRHCGVPVISCGSGVHCDGQVIVLQDIMGMPGGVVTRFNKRYADVAGVVEQAARGYIEEVRGRQFPDDAHSFQMKEPQEAIFKQWLNELFPSA